MSQPAGAITHERARARARISAPCSFYVPCTCSGNSGGPVFDADTKQAVGVAFAGRNDGEGQGFIISTLVVNTFLDVYAKTGTYTVPPSLGIAFQVCSCEGWM